MTREEKFKAINQRLGKKSLSCPEAVSFLLLAQHVAHLVQQHFITAPFEVTAVGENIAAICNEFDWEITDKDIMEFCEENFHSTQVPPFFFLLKKIVSKNTIKING